MSKNSSQNLSEISALGSTGYQPVPSGNLPDGTDAASMNNPGTGFVAPPAAISVGRLPTGAGRLPAPPIFQTGSLTENENHCRTWVSINSSADFQSAVSQDCILQGAGELECFRIGRRAADYKSAIRQSAALRYEARHGEHVLTRRKFIHCASVIASGSVVGPWLITASARGADGSAPPNERINVGLIGRGLMGRGHLRVLLGRKETQVLAVCDVDRVRCEEGQRLVEETYAADRASGTYRGCAAYNDYRELIARPDIDAVVIVTPDHWHSLASIDAAAAGKDVYCEKPISLTIREGQRLVEAVRRNACVFQTGTQYRSIPTIRQVCEFVRRGGLGRVKQVFTMWAKTQVPKIGPSYVPLDPSLPAEPVPDGLDWNLWVGPATWRPYNAAYHRNPPPGVVPWVFCDAFGAGAVTGYQSHAADVIQYALGMETSGPVEIFHPSGGEFPTLTFRYANGTLLHHVDHWGQVKDLYHAVPAGARLAGNFGGIFVGERGWITSMSTGGPIEASPESLFHEMQLTTREVNIGANNHHANWFECIRTRLRPSSHEEIGHRSASLGHLATIGYTLERSLKWDPATEEFYGDPQANRLRSRAMREPWRV